MAYSSLDNAHYSALAEDKRLFLESVQAISQQHATYMADKTDAAKQLLIDTFTASQKQFDAVFERLEVIAVDVLAKAPEALDQFNELYSHDFQELLEHLISFAEAALPISALIGKTFRVPASREYEHAIALSACALNATLRSSIRDRMQAIGCAVWDETKLKEIIDAMEYHTIIIPSGTVLADPNYELFSKFFIDDGIPTALLFGSGASVAVTSRGLPDGMPTWDQFVEAIVTETGKIKGWSATELDEAKKNASRNPLEQLALCQQAIPAYWDEVLDEMFSWATIEGKIKNVSLFRNLHLLPFKIRMTTNYDSLYERINNVHTVNYHNLHKAIVRWSNGKWSTRAAKIHGCVDSADDLIVTEADYNKRYGDKGWSDMFRDIFHHNNVLFVGFGLSDSYFKFAFKNVIPPSAIPGRHYYIFSDEQNPDKKSYYLKEYRLELITYPKGQHQYQSYYIQDLVSRYRKSLSSKALSVVARPK